jgi:beta-glucosidase
MMSRKCFAIALLWASISIGSCLVAKAQTSPFSIEAKQKAEALLKQMTLDEKVGQLN